MSRYPFSKMLHRRYVLISSLPT